MDNKQKSFVTDALDLLTELDEVLLRLATYPDVNALLEQAFRTIHTITGGCNMFGFEGVGDVARQLEKLYSLVRQGKVQVSDELISITLHVLDEMRDLLREGSTENINDVEELRDYIKITAEFLKSAETKSIKVARPAVQPISTTDELATFFIRITPTANMTTDGIHPLIFIIQDLEVLGTAKTFYYKKSDGTIAHWDVYLSTTTSQYEIETHFLFVESECQISYKKLLNCDLLASEVFKQFIAQFANDPITREELILFVDKIKSGLKGKIFSFDLKFSDGPPATDFVKLCYNSSRLTNFPDSYFIDGVGGLG